MMTWTMRHALLLLIALLALTLSCRSEMNEKEVDTEFFYACSGGKADQVKAHLDTHHVSSNARTPDGETCLHLAAIPGSKDVTQLLLEAGADPNIRTTFEKGLRMHPLSWNMYGGHYDNVKLLLEYGANVNADFDSGNDEGTIVTVLDVCNQFLESNTDDTPHSESFRNLHNLLVKYGAKTYAQLEGEKDL